MRTFIWLGVGVCLLAFAPAAVAGPLTGNNLVKNGDFEAGDPFGTDQPTDWDSFNTTDPEGWDGVTPFNHNGGQLPPPRPGGGQYAYGDFADRQASGRIDQVIENDVPDLPKEIWVGLWVWHFTNPVQPSGGATVYVDQHSTDTHWNSPLLRSDFDPAVPTFSWTWHEFLIPVDYGFICDTIELTINIDDGVADVPGWPDMRGSWIDGVELEDRCVPEPGTAAVMLLGIPALLARRRRG